MRRGTAGRGPLVVLLAAVALWAAVSIPAALGRTTFYFRDLSQLFIPLKAFGVGELQAGHVPATNPTWALGQPFRGDPNATAFYPGNLLYLVLPFWSAFNLHLCLHWALAGVGMGLLARALAQSPAAAILAGITYAGSGWMLSALSFYTVALIAAWLPFVLLGGVLGGRRGVAWGGLALGLGLLAGDPVAALGLVPLLVLSLHAQGWRRGLATAAAITAAGALVALPQLVATVRIAPGTFRFGQGLLRSQVTTFVLPPGRLAELLIPFPFGWPAYPGERGVWATDVLPRTPLYLSLYCGIVALVLALAGARRRPALALLGAGGLALAWLGGAWPEALQFLSAGAFRSPEKLVLWTALALPLLAGHGLDRMVAEGGRRWAMWIAAGALAAGLVAALVGWLGGPSAAPEAARRQLLGGLAVASLLLALAAWGAWRRSAGVLLGAQLLALVQLYPLVLVTGIDGLANPVTASPARAVIPVEQTYPPWEPTRSPPPGAESPAWRARWEAFSLGPTPGVLAGRTYPAAPDLGGMHHRYYTLMLFRLSQAGWEERVLWARALGADLLVAPQAVAAAGARLAGTGGPAEAPAFFHDITDPVPEVWWPQRVVAAETPRRVYELASELRDPTGTAVLPHEVPHRPGAAVRLLEVGADRLVAEVDGEGGVLVVRRAFLSLWRARSGDRPLAVFPANLVLLGVEVPPGKQRVVLEVSAWPELVAGLAALSAAVSLVWLARTQARAAAPSSSTTAVP